MSVVHPVILQPKLDHDFNSDHYKHSVSVSSESQVVVGCIDVQENKWNRAIVSSRMQRHNVDKRVATNKSVAFMRYSAQFIVTQILVHKFCNFNLENLSFYSFRFVYTAENCSMVAIGILLLSHQVHTKYIIIFRLFRFTKNKKTTRNTINRQYLCCCI